MIKIYEIALQKTNKQTNKQTNKNEKNPQKTRNKNIIVKAFRFQMESFLKIDVLGHIFKVFSRHVNLGI